ncbi:MAG: F0F1 ATP synthase subunit A [Candidatus Vogelbacteria bacterium]|nr:F0F1 ATP synthase subunit A [Candidatus Vogelbacteria bacterium]
MPEISIKAEPILELGHFVFSNSYLLSLIVFIILLAMAFTLRRKIALVPGKLQSVFELLTEQFLGLMDGLLGDRRKSEKYFPVVATVFLFVLVSNWIGLFPGVGSVLIQEAGSHTEEIKMIPLLRAPAADLNFTVALALVAMLFVQFFGILALGFKKYANKFFTLKNPIYTFVGLLELLSEFVKIVSFSFRLFGNVFAGEVLLTIVSVLVPYAAPLPFLFLETFVGFIQAFIFSMLTLVFIAMSVTDHEEEHENHSAQLAVNSEQ